MTHDAWPSSDLPPGPLPRIEELPVAEQGYEQEAVRQAFDSFYRHAAQLDASLRALEGIDVFRRDADALRNDLRALRALGGLQEPAWTAMRYETPGYRSVRPAVPAVVLRLAAETALIVAVAVIAGVSHIRPVVVVALMAAAFVIVAFSEWLAGRARFVPPALAFLPPGPYGYPAQYAEAPGWGVTAAEPDETTEPEGLTIVSSPEEVAAAPLAAVDPWERGPEVGPEADSEEAAPDEGEPENVGLQEAAPQEAAPEDGSAEPVAAEDEPVPGDRAGLFRRRRR